MRILSTENKVTNGMSEGYFPEVIVEVDNKVLYITDGNTYTKSVDAQNEAKNIRAILAKNL